MSVFALAEGSLTCGGLVGSTRIVRRGGVRHLRCSILRLAPLLCWCAVFVVAIASSLGGIVGV